MLNKDVFLEWAKEKFEKHSKHGVVIIEFKKFLAQTGDKLEFLTQKLMIPSYEMACNFIDFLYYDIPLDDGRTIKNLEILNYECIPILFIEIKEEVK